MKFFVYGKLKSDQPKAWMIPFSKAKPYTLQGYKMYMRPEGTAGMILGEPEDYVTGEIIEAKWARKWLLGKLLLFFLDLNEGTFRNVYRRVRIDSYPTAKPPAAKRPWSMWTYLFEKSVEDCEVICEWYTNQGEA